MTNDEMMEQQIQQLAEQFKGTFTEEEMYNKFIDEINNDNKIRK